MDLNNLISKFKKGLPLLGHVKEKVVFCVYIKKFTLLVGGSPIFENMPLGIS